MNEIAEQTTSDLRQALQRHLAEDLAAVNEILRQQFRSSAPFVSDVLDHVAGYRGKQIRPLLLLLNCRMAGCIPTKTAQTLAAVVELIHTATLVHDDIIDESETRRHVATVHRRWNTETSVLLGDFLFSRSFHLAASTGDAEACRLIGLATDRTCEGELNQVAARLCAESDSNSDLSAAADAPDARWRPKPASSEAICQETACPETASPESNWQDLCRRLTYFRIVRDKTGQLFALSCLLGARCAGASDDLQRAARRFGMRLGIAFQIADDVLDLQATAECTGKDRANDIVNHRLTLPLQIALQSLDAVDRDEFLRQLSRAGESNAEILCTHPAVEYGITSAMNISRRLTERAKRDLSACRSGTDRDLLFSIADFAVRRNF